MRKNIESILLSVLLGISILLGLSFWLDIKFSFNIFCVQHWDELSRLQASNTPVDNTFYISIGVAIFLFMVGLYFIYRQKIIRIFIPSYEPPKEIPVINKSDKDDIIIPVAPVMESHPPKLNLPKNISDIAAAKYASHQQPATQENTDSYNKILSDIFSENGYLVKTNPTISGLKTNLFAIGLDEQLWIGCVNCDLEKFKQSVIKLNSVFQDTLEDIEIHINAFILDTHDSNSFDPEITIFHSIDEIKQLVSENPSGKPDNETEQDNFNAYSEYIDTIIQYIKNV